MGLDYSIMSYIKKEKLVDCLNWLNKNSLSKDSERLTLYVNDEPLILIGEHFALNDRENKAGKNAVAKGFDRLFFSTSLVFDIDSKIIANIEGWDINIDSHEDFLDAFKQFYLGNGKMSVGYFDAVIQKSKIDDIYLLSFTAVTTDMSIMLEKSISVKKWILEFSKNTDALMTWLDQENNGKKIMYYNGEKIDMHINGKVEEEQYKLMADLMTDCYDYRYGK